MMQADHIEELVCLIAALDRSALTHQLTQFRGSFPVDFSADFLTAQTVDRLRHLLFALCVQSQHIPDLSEPTTV